MKLLTSLLLILIVQTTSFAQTYFGNVIFNNQTEINTFGALEYDKITGNLEIKNTTITDLSSLSTLTEVLGNVTIENNDSLSSLNGLHNISSMVDLNILNNDLLTSLNGLNGLNTLYNLNINYNDGLINLNGLEGLNFVANDLYVLSNQALETLTGLDNLSEMQYEAGELAIVYNDNLTSVNSLNALTICSKIHFNGNFALTHLNAFAGLKKAKEIFFFLNPELISIDSAFHQLDTLEDLNYQEQHKVASLNNFSNLKTCEDIKIEFNFGLKSVDFSNLISCTNIDFLGNDSLENMGSFDALTNLNTFELIGSSNLEHLPHFPVLDSIIFLELSGISSLESLTGLENISKILYLGITYSPLLTNLHALNGLTDLGSLYLKYNHSLKSLDGLENITELNSVHIKHNDSLSSYCALGQFINALGAGETINYTVTGNLYNPLFSDLQDGDCVNCPTYPIDLSMTSTLQQLSSNQGYATYQWLDGDNNYAIITDDTLQNITSSTYGNVAVEINYYGCIDTTANFINCTAYPINLSITDSEYVFTANQDSATYQWLDCDNGFTMIPGDTNQFFSSTLYGNIAVEINRNGCIDTTDCIINCAAGIIDLSITETLQEVSANQNSATYQWLDCDNNYTTIPNDTLQALSSTTHNNVAVEISYLGCIDTTDCITNCTAYPINLSVTETENIFTANQDFATYQWLDCNNDFSPILGETGQTFSSTTYGNIAVEINRNGCVNTTDCITNCLAYPIDLSVSETENVFTANQDSATYQWLDCDNDYLMITGETSQSFSSTTYGHIAVEINRNGCVDTTDCITNCLAYPINLSVSETENVFMANQDSATYQWLDCDNNYTPITGETSQSFSSTIYGHIAVEINRNGCVDTTDCITNCGAFPIDLSVSETENVFTANQDFATYQWLDCDNDFSPILGETGQAFSSTTYGYITVEINRNGCVDTTDCITNCGAFPIDLSVSETENVFTANQDSATYQWLDCDNGFAIILGDTNQFFSSTLYGNIAVEINRNGCVDTTDCITNCGAFPIDLSVSETGNVFTANQDSATYQWLDCDNNYSPITNETSQAFSSTTYGHIAVEINRNGCIDTTDCITNCGAFPIDLSVTETGNVFTANQNSATYQWLDCNNGYVSITGETSQSFSSTIYDNIAVEINRNGCIDTTDCITNCGVYPIDLSIHTSGQLLTVNQDSATYQWLNCDNNYSTITGENEQEFTSNTYGNFAVEINYYGCIDTTECVTLETLNTVIIHPFDLISIHPNPVSDITTIDFGNLTNLNITVYNQLGQTVFKDQKINQTLYTLNTSNLSSGVYLIEVYDAYTRKQLRIIKQ